MNKKMQRILKEADCASEQEYYDQLISTYQNGNKADARAMYQGLSGYYKQGFIKALNSSSLIGKYDKTGLIIHINKV